MRNLIERLKVGIIQENPIFMQVLGMCPTLAVTTSAENGLGMGLATTAVLMGSNLVIALIRKLIPSKVRIPAFIVVIATFVTMIDLLLQAYLPDLHNALGLFIPLIVVNCLILSRAEAYASKNSVLPSLFDGLGMGIGFTVALTVIGVVRELFGAGMIFGMQIMPDSFEPAVIMVLAPGAFFVLGILLALFNVVKNRKANA
ncbi:electron transport complex subunit RsxE [Vallitalea okinawensis]|uniref:electron transport complex subunit RsxE n=1 Tax=Vallitalea okinawensis TaxID=2078660 RepID=UPI000CFB9017|nr:electron transport complex subunit E [Vallitalea okinawensis]